MHETEAQQDDFYGCYAEDEVGLDLLRNYQPQ